MNTKKQKSQAKQYVNDNPVEALRSVPVGVSSSIVKDLVKGSGSSVWEQFLGVGSFATKKEKSHGELAEGEELSLAKLKKQEEKKEKAYVDPGLDYRRDILRYNEKTTSHESREIQMQIQVIMVEIKKLAASAKELEVQFKEVIVEQNIEKPGKYHVTFFEWVLSVLQAARLRVEESASWLAMFASKKNKKQYWGMFKRHGTTFGLSNERVVATQTG